MKLRIGESSRTSLTGLSALLRNAMFIFPPMNPVGSSLSLGRRHGLRVRPRSPFRPILCNSAPFLEVGRRPTGSLRGVTSEISPLLAIAYSNRGGIPPNRAHAVLPLWPDILTISRGNPDTKKHDILLNLGPRMGQNRSKSAVQPSCTGCAR
jgi:hypothetical protein